MQTVTPPELVLNDLFHVSVWEGYDLGKPAATNINQISRFEGRYRKVGYCADE